MTIDQAELLVSLLVHIAENRELLLITGQVLGKEEFLIFLGIQGYFPGLGDFLDGCPVLGNVGRDLRGR